jgi:hypothetical protein
MPRLLYQKRENWAQHNEEIVVYLPKNCQCSSARPTTIGIDVDTVFDVFNIECGEINIDPFLDDAQSYDDEVSTLTSRQ